MAYKAINEFIAAHEGLKASSLAGLASWWMEKNRRHYESLSHLISCWKYAKRDGYLEDVNRLGSGSGDLFPVITQREPLALLPLGLYQGEPVQYRLAHERPIFATVLDSTEDTVILDHLGAKPAANIYVRKDEHWVPLLSYI
jgi:hypothetical protein